MKSVEKYNRKTFFTHNFDSNQRRAYIYSTGSVTVQGASTRGGGLVGEMAGNAVINNAYSIGCATGGGGSVGAMVGDEGGAGNSVSNSYWNSQICSAGGGTALGTGEITSWMQDTINYQTNYGASWNFSTTWFPTTGGNYPTLR